MSIMERKRSMRVMVSAQALRVRRVRGLLGVISLALFVAMINTGCTGIADPRNVSASAAPTTPTAPPLAVAPNVPLDQYGGREDVSCTNTTGVFILEKVGNRWYFCDPLGSAFISMSVGNAVPNGNPTYDCNHVNTYPIYTAKYGVSWDPTGTGNNWGWQTLKRMTTWGFNSLGVDSEAGSTLPWATCIGCGWPRGKQPIPLPIVFDLAPSNNAATNRNGYLKSPVKDEIDGTTTNYTGYRGSALYDFFDTGLSTEFTSELKSGGVIQSQVLKNNPYILGIVTDDQDQFWGMGAGPDFISGNHTNANVGWITLLTTPVRTFIKSTLFLGQRFLYSDTLAHSKVDATNPSVACSITSPCSLRDYLWQKYTRGPEPKCVKAGDTGITALNDCWGSNYSTFDSTGTQVTGEAIGTGDGSTITFTHTLTHTSVSPFTIQVLVAGAVHVGDCPWFDTESCASGQSSNTGSLLGTTANYTNESTSIINYSTGAVSITFTTPPASGQNITINYIYRGWMAGGTGLMDESGGTGSQSGCPTTNNSTCWVGTNSSCLEGPDSNYPTYFACTGGSFPYSPAVNANPNFGADIDAWVSQMSAQYFKTFQADLKNVGSKLPYLGLLSNGSWGAPPFSRILQGEAPYVNGIFTGGMSPSSLNYANNFATGWSYLTRYVGDLPIVNVEQTVAEPDSSMFCNASIAGSNVGYGQLFATQGARGLNFYNSVSGLLNNLSYNNTYPVVGDMWWGWQDFQNQNWGLVSIHDNAYDGHETITSTVSCSAPVQAFFCGGEAANYGDVISQVRLANVYWLTK